jgi:hypothetical protein
MGLPSIDLKDREPAPEERAPRPIAGLEDTLQPTVEAADGWGSSVDPSSGPSAAAEAGISKALFGMQAAELQLMLDQEVGRFDQIMGPESPTSAAGDREIDPNSPSTCSDEIPISRQTKLEETPEDEKHEPRRSDNVRIEAIASMKEHGAVWDETETMPAVSLPNNVLDTLEPLPSGPPSSQAPGLEVSSFVVTALGRILPGDAGPVKAPPPPPEKRFTEEFFVPEGSGWTSWRPIQLLAAAALFAATFLPLSASTWSRLGNGTLYFDDLAPLALAVAAVALIVPRRVPKLAQLVLGFGAAGFAEYYFLEVGFLRFSVGTQPALQLGFVLAGCLLLLILGATAYTRGHEMKPKA